MSKPAKSDAGVRTRLTPQQRRDQLLDHGSRRFAHHRYDDVEMGDIAHDAGVSRALVYHYFPTKREFFIALVERETERMRELARPTDAAEPEDRLRDGIEAYLGYCSAHPSGMRALYRGAASSDPEIGEILSSHYLANEHQILTTLGHADKPPALLRLAIRAWWALLRAAAHAWLDAPEIPQAQIRELCATSFTNIIASLTDAEYSPERE